MLTMATFHKTVASSLVALLLCPLNAHSQSRTPPGGATHEPMKLGRLKVPVELPFESLLAVKAPAVNQIAVPNMAQQTSPPKCRRGRRTLIGALIGAGGTLPFIGLVHT